MANKLDSKIGLNELKIKSDESYYNTTDEDLASARNRNKGKLPVLGPYVQSTVQSYSGCDISVVVIVYDPAKAVYVVRKLGSIGTLSYSIHREIFPVRTLGHAYAKGYIKGPRTIAGTIVGISLDRTAMWDVLYPDSGDPQDYASRTPLVDNMPPFDVSLTFTNELGHLSVMRIYGLVISDHGGTFSIDDMMSEETFSYVARDIDLLSANKEGVYGPEGKTLMTTGGFFKGIPPHLTEASIEDVLKQDKALLEKIIQDLKTINRDGLKIDGSEPNPQEKENAANNVYMTALQREVNKLNIRLMAMSQNQSRKRISKQYPIYDNPYDNSSIHWHGSQSPHIQHLTERARRLRELS